MIRHGRESSRWKDELSRLTYRIPLATPNRAYRFPTRFLPVDPTDHNPNTPPAAMPLVSGPTIRLPGHHVKVRPGGQIL